MKKRNYRSFGVFGICIGIFTIAMDWSVVNNALPAIQRGLKTSFSEMQWILSAFGLSMTVFLVTMGRLGDIIGRRKLFIIGLLIAWIASLGAGLSPSPSFLIVCRCFLGLSMAILMPCSQALVSHAYPVNLHGKALGVWMTAMGIGLAVGPLIGGIITDLLSWHWIFYFNLPFLLISCILTFFFIKESKNKKQSKKLDFVGIGHLTIGLGSLVFAIIEASSWGWSSPVIWSLFGLSLIGFIAFYFHENKASSPLIKFDFFKNKQFLAGSLGAFSIVFLFWGIFFITPLYLQNIRNFSPAFSGVFMLAHTIPFSLCSHYTGVISDRIEKKKLAIAGLLISTIGLFLMTFYTAESSLILTALSLFCCGIGGGIMFGPTVSLGISSIPRSYSGVAAGAVSTLQEMGGTFGLALVGTLLFFTEKSELRDQLNKEGLNLSSSAIDKLLSLASFRDKMEAFVQNFSDATQTKIMTAYGNSFVHGLHCSVWLCVMLALTSSFILFVLLKKKEKA